VVQPAGGDCGFEEAAIDAVKKWRYKPGTKNGEAVDVKITVVVEFMLS
jgi:TonB family protein